MNTTTNTTNRPSRRLSATMKCLLPLMAAGALASCGTQSITMTQSDLGMEPSAVPVRVLHNRPAELPRGVADDAPTNGWAGRWGSAIEYGDADDIIPLVRFTLPL